MSLYGRFLLLLIVVLLPVAASGAEVDAGPIWNNIDAQRKCGPVCAQAGGTWTGHWRTTQMGRQSVCDCKGARRGHHERSDRHGRRGSGSRIQVDARALSNDIEAKAVCSNACLFAGGSYRWDGSWRRSSNGEKSRCGCEKNRLGNDRNLAFGSY